MRFTIRLLSLATARWYVLASASRLFVILALSLTVLSCSQRAPSPATPSHLAARLSGVALPFVENVGQSDPRVAYYASTFSGTVFVTHNGELVYALPGRR